MLEKNKYGIMTIIECRSRRKYHLAILLYLLKCRRSIRCIMEQKKKEGRVPFFSMLKFQLL